MRIYKYFKDMKFRYKLMVTYVSLVLIPICILAALWYSDTKEVLINKEKDNITNYLTQAVSNMDNQLSIYDNLSDYIGFNQTISNVVDHNYGSYYDMYNQITNILDPMLSSLKYFHNDINNITIYARNDIVKHDTTLAPISEIENSQWYGTLHDSNSIHWFISKENKKAFSARNMPTIQMDSEVGVLYIDVDYDKLFKSFSQMEESNYGIFVIDENGNDIYEYSRFEDDNKLNKLSFDDYKENINSNDYTVVQVNSKLEDWKIVLYKPQGLSYKAVNSSFKKTMAVLAFFIVVSLITSIIVSKFMVSDIENLRENMKNIENGNMEITINSDSKDEIGDLIRGFRQMIFQIKALIEDVYESKIIQKDYEMKALQAQINPHFLYNTLSLINWMAIEAKQDDISKITLSLSTFYRTALNKGKNILPVRDEIKNMKSYLEIQLMMHDYDFDVEINIDEEIMNYKILNLLLQPLVENAIDHGIDLKTDGRSKITINGFQKDDNIILIVKDNGVGMPKGKIDTILTNKSRGYGVRNVNERIKLYYGSEYSLKIRSEINKGTEIKVTIPIE